MKERSRARYKAELSPTLDVAREEKLLYEHIIELSITCPAGYLAHALSKENKKRLTTASEGAKIPFGTNSQVNRYTILSRQEVRQKIKCFMLLIVGYYL